jgi:hypothetical protein
MKGIVNKSLFAVNKIRGDRSAETLKWHERMIIGISGVI